MKHLLTTTSLPRPVDGHTITETPQNLRRLGHSWRSIEHWAMTGCVHWEPGERERMETTR